LLGDSFTLGWGSPHEQTYAAVLQRLVGDKAEVINAAYHGVSPDAYYAYLRREGLELQPDLIVLESSGYVDRSDFDLNVWTRTDESGAPLEIAPVATPGADGIPITAPWYDHVPILRDSYLVNGFGQLLKQILGWKAPQAEAGSATGAEAKMRTSLEAINKALRAAHIKCLVLNIPPPFPNRYLQYRVFNDKTLEEQIKLWGADVIKLQSYLRPDDYSLLHGHFSQKGGETVARLIRDRIPISLGGSAP
jgi:hypothetical protein